MVASAAMQKTLLVILGAAVLECITALVLVPLTNRDRVERTDFVNFYIGASMVREGKGPILYDRGAQDEAYRKILGRKSNQYFLHPAFEAAALAPLTSLGLERGFLVWNLVNVGLLGL